ncbi:hypothetical protein [Allostreptomyces psammosilenae]|uniref:Secreted protein n=1 Tax=Allostreptomyces psammosilenae TaxID=1892865 RepID=A0A853A5I8_9ACTN|nr:hypothetical protein [Allostreptomyces psammosilenae]NYI05951.1 hypothetical protein [Allostreptomyces psammosilenae]
MTALTAAAIVAIAGLAYLAEGTIAAPPAATGSASPSPDASSTAPPPVPADSGDGKRVVYSLEQRRVWLMGAEGGETPLATFTVMPSTVDPLPGAYQVTSRSESVTGSDGIPVRYVVRFTTVDGVTVGFSAAADGSTPRPDPNLRTGGIRQTLADSQTMWEFAVQGTSVVVVP